jgi:hypothetical protein
MLTLICLLVGAVLGQRFKVQVLITAMALAVAAAAGLAHASTFWQILGAVLVATTCLQIGYLAGVGIRYLMAAVRMGRMQAGSHAASESRRRVANLTPQKKTG